MTARSSSLFGWQLCVRLLTADDAVICRFSFFIGIKDSIAQSAKNPHFELIGHYVTSSLYVELDGIKKLVRPASPIRYQRDPLQTTWPSMRGAASMMALLASVSGEKVFQASRS